MRKSITFGIVMGILALIPIILYANNAFGAPSVTTTIDSFNKNSREYTYCPLSSNDLSSFTGEVDGCPLARVYVNNWNSLSSVQQSTIDTLLRSKGFVDIGENPTVK